MSPQVGDIGIRDGIEWFTIGEETECQCARCGSSAGFEQCENCGGEGVSGHECGEDSCCCWHPEDNRQCDYCKGTGGSYCCLSTREWCEASPMPGREHIRSTAIRGESR